MRVAGIIIKDGRLLLIKRISGGDTYYVLPGGHPEDNETPEEALEREISEETTLDIRVGKLFYTQENPSPRYNNHKEHYYLCSTDSEYIELDKTSIEYQETIQGKNIYVPMWIDLEVLPKLQIYPPSIKNLLIKQNFPSRYYKGAHEKYIHPQGRSISKPHHEKMIGKTIDEIANLIETVSKYIFSILTVISFIFMAIAYFGEIRIELPPASVQFKNESKIKLVSGSFWPTVIYITRNGYIVEILPKNLIFNEDENSYFSYTSGLWKSYRLEGGSSKYSYRGGMYKWIPVGFFATLTSLFLFLALNRRSKYRRLIDDD